MNKTLSYILVGGASALIGAVAGYFFCKKKIENGIEEEVVKRVNNELASIRQRKTNETKQETLKNKEDGHAFDSGVVSFSDEELNNAANLIREEFSGYDLDEYRVSLLATALISCNKKGLSDEETDRAINELIESFDDESSSPSNQEDEIEELSEPQRVMEEYENQPPRVIPSEDYRNLPPYFDFVTYQYFEDDDVLLDDGEQIIDDVNGIVWDALEHFGEDPDDADCVYVVNGNLGLAIEIERRHMAYSEWAF